MKKGELYCYGHPTAGSNVLLLQWYFEDGTVRLTFDGEDVRINYILKDTVCKSLTEDAPACEEQPRFE